MCSKVVQPSSLVVVFETLLSSAATIVDDEKGNPAWQARADFYITCILSCLPWGGAELGEVYFLLLFLLYFGAQIFQELLQQFLIRKACVQEENI